MLVMMGVRTEEHCLRSQVGIGSESDCLLGQLCKILEISDSESGLKVKVGGVVGGGTKCGESVEELADKARRSLDIFSVKKVARLSASELAEVQEGRGEDDLRCSRLLIVCQRKRGMWEEEDTRLE